MAFWRRIIKWLSYRRLINPIQIEKINNPVLTRATVINEVKIEARTTVVQPFADTVDVNGKSTVIAEEDRERIYINIQNVGLNPCLIALGNDTSDSCFNFVLAADTGIRQGNGGALELKEWQGLITAICENGETTLAVAELRK